MPDLITHISFNYIVQKFIKKYSFLTLFLFGAIYPDLFVALQYFLIDFLKLRPIEPIIACCVTSHSIFFIFLSALALSIYFPRKIKAFFSLFTGMLLHLLLDFFQRNFGGGNILLFPFNFNQYYKELFIYGVTFKYIYIIVPLLILFYIVKSEKETLIIKFNLKKIIFSAVIFIILGLTVIVNINNIIHGNIFYLDLKYHPDRFDGKQIELCKKKIIKSDPPMVYFRGRNIKLKNVKVKLSNSDKVYVRGIFNNKESSVNVLEIYRFGASYKFYISGIGILIFLIFVAFKVKFIFIYQNKK